MNARAWMSGSLIIAGLAAGCATIEPEPTASVMAAAETARVGGSGDAADDPGFWLASDPADSLILGTDKTAGLYVYDLAGEVLQFLPVGRLNNVDVRDGFMTADGATVAIAAATNRTTVTLDLFIIDPATGTVMVPDDGAIPLDLDDEPYGVCLYMRDREGLFAGVTAKDGTFVQYQIIHDDEGFGAIEARRFDLGSITEGCVFDERSRALFIAEENVGVWRYGADHETGDVREAVAAVDGRRLVADAEGATIYAEGEDGGYLIVSSQGDDAYAVFALPQARYVGRFSVADNAEAGVDGTTETDGIMAVSDALPGYPEGVFIVQDDADDEGGQNFKIIDWRDIAAALNLP